MKLDTEFTPRDFRNTVGRFATGIAVVTTRVGDDVAGMTVNSFTSVSLEPPLVLICVEKGGTFLERITSMTERGLPQEFAVSFLTAEQEGHSRRFARQEGGEELLEPVFWGEGPPFVHGASGGVSCVVHQTVDAGDHVVVIGRVTALWEAGEERGALLYYRGRYRTGHF
jgi:flavin reductase (DIM6/NTAB) family NADH-FMN oxidoreductase RutF